MVLHLNNRLLKTLCFSVLFTGTVLISYAQELFVSTELTPSKSFTSGAEGPAVGPTGIIYAVNYARQGTIGQITVDGKSSLFLELPSGTTFLKLIC